MKSLLSFTYRFWAFLAPLALAALALAPAPAPAASAKSFFVVGHSQFHALKKDSKKAKFRSSWQTVEKSFARSLKQDADGPYAPKSLYYIGRVYEELGTRSGLKSDFRKAVDYFQRVASRYPRHGWTDDCLYRAADIYARRLNETTNARKTLARIIVEYPRADMHAKAKTYLKKLGKYQQYVAAAQKKASGLDAAAEAAQIKAKPKIAAKAKTTTKATLGKPRDPSGSVAHLDTVRFKSSDEYTRVVLELDARVKYRYQALEPNPEVDRPHRLYIDLQGSRLGHDVQAATTVSDGILRSIRTGQYDAKTTRVVLDFNAMQEYKVFPLDNPFRIVVDVYGQGTDAPVRTAAKARPATSGKQEKYQPPKGSKKMAGDLLEQLGLTVNTIMLDPGHGGRDPGAVANGVREKDLNLKFAKILGSKLEAQGFTVYYTRLKDVFIPLEQRTAMANVKKADLFISIHANANRSSKVSGLETYSLNLAKTKDAVRIAARENAVDPRSISDLQFILTDLMVNSKIKESRDLASDVQTNTLSKVRSNWSVRDKGTREAPFYVLMGAKMPSILVELGYITNPTEAKRLKSSKYLDYLASGLVNGVIAYKKKIERYAMN